MILVSQLPASELPREIGLRYTRVIANSDSPSMLEFKP